MKSINEDIKNGQMKTVYLLYGEEAYLKRQYRDKLKKALIPEGDTMNFSAYEGKDVEIKQLLKEALTDKLNDRAVYMKGIDTSYFYEGYNLFKSEEL